MERGIKERGIKERSIKEFGRIKNSPNRKGAETERSQNGKRHYLY
jgi:hypothetical protein